MDETYNTLGIVIDRVNYREKDLLVNFFSFDRGLMKLVARGAKKINSKLAGHLEPMNLIEAMVVRGKGFNYLGTALNKNCFLNIKKDFEKIIQIGKVFNLKKKFLKENNCDIENFLLLRDYLFFLDFNYKISDFDFLYSVYRFKFLQKLGYEPELKRCFLCKKNIFNFNDNLFQFSFLNGSLICKNCFLKSQNQNQKNIFILNQDLLKILIIILNKDFFYLSKINIKKKINIELSNFLDNLFQFHLN